MVSRPFLSFTLAGQLLALAAMPALAAPGLSLAYDSPTVTVAPGGSVDIGATLSVSSAFGALNTDAFGSFSGPSSTTTLSISTDDLLMCARNCTSADPIVIGPPFVVPTPNPLANLHVAAGSSVHIDLGTLTISNTLPDGVFQTDVGIYEQVSVDLGNAICACFTMVSAFAPPDIDAGPLTIDVGSDPVPLISASRDPTSIPEPAGVAIFTVGIVALGTVRRRAASWGHLGA